MANKSTTIKKATDKELDELIVRLKKENELGNLIEAMKRRSDWSPLGDYGDYNVSADEVIETLYHYGIPGMRWGRKKVNPSNYSEDFKKKNQLRKKKISEMSNADLKELTTRMQLERQFKDLKKSEMSEGKKFVVDIMKEIGKDLVRSSLKSGVNAIKKKG